MGEFPSESFDRDITSGPPEYFNCPSCDASNHIDDEECVNCGMRFELDES